MFFMAYISYYTSNLLCIHFVSWYVIIFPNIIFSNIFPSLFSEVNRLCSLLHTQEVIGILEHSTTVQYSFYEIFETVHSWIF